MSLEAQDFERWWPDVARRLTRAMARRGVIGQDAEDVVQETALRVLASAPDVASATELLRWSFTVSRRIEIDRARRRGRSELLAAELSRLRIGGADVARAAESRVALAATARGMASLSDTDRAALLSALDEDAPAAVDRRTAVREAVRRHRARVRLVAAVGKLVGTGIAGTHVLRRWLHKLRPQHAEVGFAMAVSTLIVVPTLSGSAVAAASEAMAPAPAPMASIRTTAADGPASSRPSVLAAWDDADGPVGGSDAVPMPTPPVSSQPEPDPYDGQGTRRITIPVPPLVTGGGGGNGDDDDGRRTTINFLPNSITSGKGVEHHTDDTLWCSTTPSPTCATENTDLGKGLVATQ